MKLLAFYSRNRKEVFREPVSIIFGIGLPILLLLLISIIQNSLPETPSIFLIKNFAPGIAVFSLSFIALFSGMLLANDRSNSFLIRLYTSPLTATDYILGYALPFLPVAIIQSAVCFITAFFMGLPISINVLYAIISLVPVAILFLGVGLLLGSLFSNKQVAPISSIIVQIAALSSGMWFDLTHMGGAFKKFCYLLPFAHSVDLAKGVLNAKSFAVIYSNLLWVLGYAIVTFSLAVVIFKRKMKG